MTEPKGPSDKLGRLAQKAKSMQEKEIMAGQMPLWPDDRRAAPNTLIRSALFKGTMIRDKVGVEREMLDKQVIEAVAGYTILYSGRVLDQRDFNTWLAVIQAYRSQYATDMVRVSGYELLRLSGLTNTGKNQRELKERLRRLKFTLLEIEPDDPRKQSSFHGSLISDFIRGPDGKNWDIRLSPEVLLLFHDGHSWVDWEIRQTLKGAPLAQWLHMFYLSHARPFKYSISRLHQISGSETKELRFFRGNVKKAMVRLEEACRQHDVPFTWEYNKRGDKLGVDWRPSDKLK